MPLKAESQSLNEDTYRHISNVGTVKPDSLYPEKSASGDGLDAVQAPDGQIHVP